MPETGAPRSSAAVRVRETATKTQVDSGQVPQDVWFSDWDKSADLNELSRHYSSFDTTLSMLWTTEEELPSGPTWRRRDDDDAEAGLPELTGELPWPGRKRRK